LLQTAAEVAPVEHVSHALTADVDRAIRRLLDQANEARASELADHLPPPRHLRAWLTIHLWRGAYADARSAATNLARLNAWDPTVAAVILLDDQAENGHRRVAREIVDGSVAAARIVASAASTIASASRAPGSSSKWALAITELHTLSPSRAVEALGRLHDDAGPTPWRILAALLLLAGSVDGARLVTSEGRRLFPDDLHLALVRACVPLASGNVRDAASARFDPVPDEPGEPLVWLVQSLHAVARGDIEAARNALNTAVALGVSPTLRGLGEAWISGV